MIFALESQEAPWTRPIGLGALVAALLLLVPAVRGVFIEEGLRWLYILLLSFTVSLALTPVMIQVGLKWGLVDQPAARKIHQVPTPRIGGLAIYVGFVIAVLVNSILAEWMVAIFLAGSLLLVVGVLDDVRELPSWAKLAVQVFGAGVVIYSGNVLTLFPAGPLGQSLNMLLTLIWIVGITNAFNFFDGMDGLATGLAVLVAVFMGVVAFQTNQPGLGWLAVAIIGSCLGFLPYNFRLRAPAQVFLGDGGSTFLGFTLACLAVEGNWADNNPLVSFSNPLLFFGVLIYDMIHITVERIATGKVTSLRSWIDYVGKDHLHHRLAVALGSRRAAVAMIFTLTICLGLAAIVLRQADAAEAFMLLVQAALIVIMITILEHRGRSRHIGDFDPPHASPAPEEVAVRGLAKPGYKVET
ncbi:MAG TPA: MraY family glycosyltransferase [Nitrospiraceae bacterium]|nr:MraY family glycosyltransferase [Nitrospiraceae bacterium]